MRPYGELQSNTTGVLRRRNLDTHRDTQGSYVQRRDHGGHSKETAIYKTRRDDSEETRPTTTLTLDFQPPEPWENKYLWDFVVAAGAG
jgi:hypothetical protein